MFNTYVVSQVRAMTGSDFGACDLFDNFVLLLIL